MKASVRIEVWSAATDSCQVTLHQTHSVMICCGCEPRGAGRSYWEASMAVRCPRAGFDEAGERANGASICKYARTGPQHCSPWVWTAPSVGDCGSGGCRRSTSCVSTVRLGRPTPHSAYMFNLSLVLSSSARTPLRSLTYRGRQCNMFSSSGWEWCEARSDLLHEAEEEEKQKEEKEEK